MQTLDVGGAQIAYTDQGQGDAVVAGARLCRERRRELGTQRLDLDADTRQAPRRGARSARGHGQSAKPHDPQAYSFDVFAGDVAALVEHLQLKKPDLIGFSLGARVVLRCLETRPEKFLLGVCAASGELLLDPKTERDPEGFAKAWKRRMRRRSATTWRAASVCSPRAKDKTSRARGRLTRLERNGTHVERGRACRDQARDAGDRRLGRRSGRRPEPLARLFANGKGVRVPGCATWIA